MNTKTAPHQEKIQKNITLIMDTIGSDFKDSKPILSGSFLIKLLVKPDADFSDYDFYFKKQEDYEKAKGILDKKYKKISDTKNSITYHHPDLSAQIQIVKQIVTPQQLVKSHDFANSQAAFYDKKIFLTKQFKKAWLNDSLIVENLQLPDYSKNKNIWLTKTIVLINRVNKYLNRYTVDLSLESQAKLQALLQELKNKANDFKSYDFTLNKTVKYDYYNNVSDEDASLILSYSDLINAYEKVLK